LLWKNPHNQMVKSYPAPPFPSQTIFLTFFLLCLASVAFADDFKTINGKEYKNVTVSRVEPDGIVLTGSSGIAKVYFTELPKEVQERFHYDAQNAAAYGAQQAAAYAERNAAVQSAAENGKAAVAHQQAQARVEQARQGNFSALSARLQELQQQEDSLLIQIGQAERAHRDAKHVRSTGRPYYSDPLEAQLPLLRGHLEDARRDKAELKRQLERAQR
jgi:hypothetical protein